MPEPKSTDEEAERKRIEAWREERARIAAADRAERIRQKSQPSAKVTDISRQDQSDTADALLLSAQAQSNETDPASGNSGIRSRRRSGKSGIWALFCAVVLAPLIITAFYLLALATPLYEAHSVVAITKSTETGGGSRSGLLGGAQSPSNLSEVFRAHSFVQSQALMDTLEADLGLVTDLSSDLIDPIQRLRTIPLLSVSKRSQFDRFVDSSVDIQSGLLTLYVRAPSKEQAIAVSEVVLHSTQGTVHELGQQVFDQRQAHASKVRTAAEKQVAEAQAALVALQIQYQEVDPKNRVESIYAAIRDLEAEAQQLNNEIQKAQIAGIGESVQTRQTAELRDRIRAQIDAERARLVSPDQSEGSLNAILMKYELAGLEVELAREAVQTALKAEASAGQEAALNRSILQIVVPPRTAQAAIYPNIPGTLTLVLLISLTVFAAITTLRSSRL